MSARAKNKQAVLSPRRWLCLAVIVTTVLSGCGRTAYTEAPPVPTLAPPTPAGMAELPPKPPQPPDPDENNCDRTASLQQAPGGEVPADAGEVRTQRLVQRCGAGGEPYEGCNGVIAPHRKLHANRPSAKAEV